MEPQIVDYLEVFFLYPRYYQPTYALEQSCRFGDVCAPLQQYATLDKANDTAPMVATV
jgi:hypothetical protein